MELRNEFRVDVPPAQAWAALVDVPRLARCVPGAELRMVDGAEYRGTLALAEGPLRARYSGRATFLELDETAGRAVVRAEGRESGGRRSAAATATVTLEPAGGGTRVRVVTDLAVIGAGDDLAADVLGALASRLMRRTVACLEGRAPPAPSPEPAGDERAPWGTVAPQRAGHDGAAAAAAAAGTRRELSVPPPSGDQAVAPAWGASEGSTASTPPVGQPGTPPASSIGPDHAPAEWAPAEWAPAEWAPGEWAPPEWAGTEWAPAEAAPAESARAEWATPEWAPEWAPPPLASSWSPAPSTPSSPSWPPAAPTPPGTPPNPYSSAPRQPPARSTGPGSTARKLAAVGGAVLVLVARRRRSRRRARRR